MRRIHSSTLGCDAGEIVYQQGDVGNVLYIILSGSVRVTRQDSHGEILLATLGPGEFFGEMSLLSGGRRSATVTAETDLEVEVITRSVFLEHVHDPLAQRVLLGLSDRLREVDALIEYLHVEQHKIRQDAHDRIYNRLVALSRLVEVSGLRGGAMCSDGGDDCISLQQIAADIRDTVTDLQQILSDRASVNHASMLEHDQVLEKLSGVCSSQGDIWQMGVSMECVRSLPPIPQAMCWDLECIIEEALTNSAKHGEATAVHVGIGVLDREDEGARSLSLSIVDDGRGLHRVPDISELPEHSKGLRGMHSRVQSYGGRLTLDSSREATTLSVVIPVGAP